jgi:hypothetical protein
MKRVDSHARPVDVKPYVSAYKAAHCFRKKTPIGSQNSSTTSALPLA